MTPTPKRKVVRKKKGIKEIIPGPDEQALLSELSAHQGGGAWKILLGLIIISVLGLAGYCLHGYMKRSPLRLSQSGSHPESQEAHSFPQEQYPQASLDSDSQHSNAAETPLRVEIRNGSRVQGRAQQAAETFRTDTRVSIIKVGNASKFNYPETLVVAAHKVDSALAAELAKEIGGKVVSVLPEGEFSSSADIVIILGSS